jgi:hypothetical protein
MHSDYTIQAYFVTVALCRYRVSGSDESCAQICRPCKVQAHSLHALKPVDLRLQYP